jgi:hypothetical protein
MEVAIGWEHRVFLDRVRTGVWTTLMTDGRVEVENLQVFDDYVPVGRNEEQPTGAPRPGAAGVAAACTDVQCLGLFADPVRACGSGLLKVSCTTGVNGMSSVFTCGSAVPPAKNPPDAGSAASFCSTPSCDASRVASTSARGTSTAAFSASCCARGACRRPCAMPYPVDGWANQEPNVFIEALIHRLGINPRSGVAIEMTIHMWTLYSLAIFDGHDLRRSVAGEHVARRLLQQLKAVRRNAKAPDYENLETYNSHCLDADGVAKVRGFEKHVTAPQRDLAILQ